MAGAMATASPTKVEPLEWKPVRAERTKAVPKHTLHGTTLEPLTKKELSKIEKIDVEAFNKEMLSKVKDPSQPPVPDSFRDNNPDRGRLEESRSKLDAMREEARRADRERRAREMQAFCIRGGDSASPGGAKRQYPDFYTLQDLAHAREMNKLGLNDRGSYNYDKYGKRMPVHKYSTMGDVLKPGNDFNVSSTDQVREAVAQGVSHPPQEPKGAPPDQPSGRTLMDFVETPSLDSQIPPNIRHKFGSKVVESVLKDQAKVAETLVMQREMSVGRQRLVNRLKDVPEVPPSPNRMYESLGYIGRSNVFPGHNVNVNAGVVKTTHNDEVYLHRVPPTDEFKFQRDHLSTWAEQNVLRDRVKKAWDMTHMAQKGAKNSHPEL